MRHYLDDLDSKMESMRAHFQREPGAEWTTYNASLARPLLNSKNFLAKLQAGNDPAPEVQPDAVQTEGALQDTVLECSKAAAAKEK
jgi:hypothetical protein